MKIIADIGASHGGELDNAFFLISAAANAGADMVKVQLYDPEKLASSRRAKLGDPVEWQGKWVSLIDLYRRAVTPRDWFQRLFGWAKYEDIPLFSSVFDPEGVDYLETLGCPMYKVSSYEGDDLALIDKARATGKPVYVSNPIRAFSGVTALCCVSKYPCPIDDALTLLIPAIPELKKHYDVVGFSDHTLGTVAALTAKELGATVFEKHIKLEGDETSPDAGFALTPAQFAGYVAALR